MADTYVNTAMASSHITSLMRRINALEASVTGADTYTRKWGSVGSADGEFDQPFNICVSSGFVYVTDGSNDRVQIFDTAGTFSSKFGSSGATNGKFATPYGICVYNSEIYVTDNDNDRVQVFDLSGSYQRQWGSTGTGNGNFQEPAGICEMGGEIYVVDQLNDRIQVFNTAGAYQRKWGSAGSGSGQFGNAEGIASYNSEIYVTDNTNNNVQVFNSSGTYQRSWGTTGSGAGEFTNPDAIFVYSGDVFVVDGSRFQVFTTSGSFKRQTGSSGSGNGEFNSPTGIFVYANEIYTTDVGNDRVQVFTLGTSAAQTTFNSYTTTTATSLGTPDGGVAVPALAALTAANNNADLVPRHLIDCRTAIETLAPYFDNPGTGNPYNWTAASADNLFFVANGDRTEYGATGGAAYDWTRTEAQMEGDYAYSIDIGEVLNCIATLEAS